MAAGLKEPARAVGLEQQRFQISKHHKSTIVANFDIPAGKAWADLKAFYKKPDDILPM